MPRTIPVLLVTLALLLLLPAMVFTGSALYHGMGADSTLNALAAQCAAERNNLGVVTLLVCLFVNLEFWPKFLPARQFLGFPHGLEFVIGPLFFAPIGVGVGCFAAWLIRRRSA